MSKFLPSFLPLAKLTDVLQTPKFTASAQYNLLYLVKSCSPWALAGCPALITSVAMADAAISTQYGNKAFER